MCGTRLGCVLLPHSFGGLLDAVLMKNEALRSSLFPQLKFKRRFDALVGPMCRRIGKHFLRRLIGDANHQTSVAVLHVKDEVRGQFVAAYQACAMLSIYCCVRLSVLLSAAAFSSIRLAV